MLHRIVLLFFFLTVPNICHGDVIRKVCDATPVPEVCDLCFVQDPGSSSKDARGLAGDAIHCSQKHSHFMNDMFVDVGSSTEFDPTVKPKCDSCERSIAAALKSLGDAEASWRAGRFAAATNQVGVAVDRANDCGKLVPSIPAQQNFYDNFTLLKNYYIDTKAILSKL